MTNNHPSDIEIARLIDGKANPDERERILNHIDGCDECFEVYGEVLKFMESETVRKKKVWIPLAAVVLLGAILLPFILQKIHKAAVDTYWTAKPGPKVLHHIEDNISQIEDKSSYGFSPVSKNVFVRLGFYIEDLKRLARSSENQLKEKVLQLLVKEWRNIFEAEMQMEEMVRISIDDRFVDRIEIEIKSHLENEPVEDLYSLGKYIERSIFLCIDGRFPNMKLIDKFSRISQENKLAKRIPILFLKIENEKNLESILKDLKAIQEIFL